jgi:nucleotide-binding universal stress UspA family protein
VVVQPIPKELETRQGTHLRLVATQQNRRANGRQLHGLFRRIAVCLVPDGRSARALTIACQLASEHRTRLAVIAAIQIPLDDPLDTKHPNADRAATEAVQEAQALADTYGIRADGVILRAWNPGEAIATELSRRHTEVILVPTAGLRGHDSSSPVERYVVRHAPCRVMLLRPTPDTLVARGREDVVFVADRESDYWPAGEFVDRR